MVRYKALGCLLLDTFNTKLQKSLKIIKMCVIIHYVNKSFYIIIH